MALITCKKCGQTISDQAEKCPHCGFQVPETKLIVICNNNPFTFIGSKSYLFYVNGNVVNIPLGNESGITVKLNPSTIKLGNKGNKFIKNYSFEAKENETYRCNIDIHPWLFDNAFVVTDSKGSIVLEKKKSIKTLLLFIILITIIVILMR